MAAGKILACKWVKLACRRHLKDLARQKKKSYPYRFDLEKAERICTFIELLPHTKGKWAAKRELLRLSPWQKFVLSSVFGWVRKKDGFRRFWEAYIEVPRKNG
ncbi:MAG: terminase large subunit, partial [Deltaproteobacteria bacterium]|nr:terminase large subunit [Deltaproteobacteria bacterium]